MDTASVLFSLVPQGTGWALFVVACFVIYRQYKDNQIETKLHLQDVKDITEKSQKTAEVMTINHAAALEKATKVADATFLIVQNLQQSSNIRQQ